MKKNDKIKQPKWTDFCKTAVGRELAPYDPDWLYIRAAAIARKVYLRGHTGVGRMTHLFGGKERNGVIGPFHAPSHAKIIRYCLQ